MTQQLELLREKIKIEIAKPRMSSSYYGGYKQALVEVENMIFEMLSQLPQQEISDEEIEEEISKRYMQPTMDYAFRDGCKWYREKLKQL